MSNSLQPHGLQHASFPVLHCLLEFVQTHVHWVSDAIQPSYPPSPLSSLPSIFPTIRVFSNDSALCSGWPKYWSFSISPPSEYSGLISFRIYWLLSHCCTMDSQESSPASHFKIISSSTFSLLYGPALTSILDFWINHDLDYTELCGQSDVSAL